MRYGQRIRLWQIFPVIFIFFLVGWFSTDEKGDKGNGNDNAENILNAMKSELDRSMEKLKLPDFESPYFISYLMRERDTFSFSARDGALYSDNKDKARSIYCETRVGNHHLDSSNIESPGFQLDSRYSFMDSYMLSVAPLEDNVPALKDALWLLTDFKYKDALSSYLKKKGDKVFNVEKKNDVDDFSVEEKQIHTSNTFTFKMDEEKWKESIRKASLLFKELPGITTSEVEIDGRIESKYFVNSEGSLIFTSYPIYLASASASLVLDDGEEIGNADYIYARTPEDIFNERALSKSVSKVMEELKLLKAVSRSDPYTAPAILSPTVTGVFFHEAVGHRLEGERQRLEKEGQTFKGKIGTKVIPDFITVEDDPTLKEYNGTELNGFYEYDDEGVKAQKVTLISNGILQNYLMSRTPVEGFPKSNGHGRSSGLQKPMGRMGNIIVRSSREFSEDKLKEMLIAEAKKRGKTFGFIVKDIEGGGETSTTKLNFQAFRSTPKFVYRVDVETGKEELVRGVEIVGTPLISINRIIATGKDYDVFNGYCSAESGSVPVSTVAPSVLIEEIELQRKPEKKTRPPIMPRPDSEAKN